MDMVEDSEKHEALLIVKDSIALISIQSSCVIQDVQAIQVTLGLMLSKCK